MLLLEGSLNVVVDGGDGVVVLSPTQRGELGLRVKDNESWQFDGPESPPPKRAGAGVGLNNLGDDDEEGGVEMTQGERRV